jgi:hypothetical protein
VPPTGTVPAPPLNEALVTDAPRAPLATTPSGTTAAIAAPAISLTRKRPLLFFCDGMDPPDRSGRAAAGRSLAQLS